MAQSKNNIVMRNTSGALGKQVVFRVMNGKTFVSKYPDRSQVIYNKEQLEYRELFAKANKFASDIVNDQVKMSTYPKRAKTSVFHSALKDFMAANTNKTVAKKVKWDIGNILKNPGLNARQIEAVKYLSKRKIITNSIYQELTGVSKATATRDLQKLVQLNVFTEPSAKGAGSSYSLLLT